MGATLDAAVVLVVSVSVAVLTLLGFSFLLFVGLVVVPLRRIRGGTLGVILGVTLDAAVVLVVSVSVAVLTCRL